MCKLIACERYSEKKIANKTTNKKSTAKTAGKAPSKKTGGKKKKSDKSDNTEYRPIANVNIIEYNE